MEIRRHRPVCSVNYAAAIAISWPVFGSRLFMSVQAPGSREASSGGVFVTVFNLPPLPGLAWVEI